MSYDQKRKVLEYVIKTEQELGICKSSWKHCLLFLHLNGTLTQEELMREFTTPGELEVKRLKKLRSETFDSIPTPAYNRQ